MEDHYRRKHFCKLSPQHELPPSSRTSGPARKTEKAEEQPRRSLPPMVPSTSTNTGEMGMSAGGRNDHARCVHEVEDDITFAFESTEPKVTTSTPTPPPATTNVADRKKIQPNKISPPALANTLTITGTTGKSAGKLIPKKWKCEFCKKRFASQSAVLDHARRVHDVEDIFTYTFEGGNEPVSKTQPEERNVTASAENEFACTWCSGRRPLSFLSQEALDRHVSQCHFKNKRARDAPVSKPKNKKEAVWCPHCARLLSPQQSLSQHIRAVHNDSFKKKNDGQTHTKVVRFAREDIADASACPSTPVYNVHCPDELSPHEATTSHVNSEPALPARTEASHSNPTLAGDANVTCDMCGQACRTRKGLTYHLLRNHGVPVGKRKGQRASKKEDPDRNPSPPPSQDTNQQVSMEDVVASTCTAGVSILGETIRLAFPLPKVLACRMSEGIQHS
ncbi:hypothetical protein TNIN_438461 [Trichonephila inaurata madagascariensis]|uniref:C2H2-type domain-containing protein n=1 Tax=Trichonephila inaurata madagascariensis TaxID=2747483 RepID=A0A8X6WWP2_9ARAC|nr:hypothetical protein TNIN_438461 [Trichonephila inaurata madagascariensis]